MARELPVTIAVARADGRTEHVRIGTAIPEGDGFRLRLDELHIGGVPAASASAPAPSVFTPPTRRAPAGAGPTNFPNYGRSKGAPIEGATVDDLEYYANGARRSLADPSKSRFHDKERALLAAIEAELAGRDATDRRPRGPAVDDAYEPPRPTGPSYSSAPPDDLEPPPLDDEDIPPF